jgi:hypothetical protein
MPLFVFAVSQLVNGSEGARLFDKAAISCAFGSDGGVSSANILPNCQRTANHPKTIAKIIIAANPTRTGKLLASTVFICA